MKITAHFEVYHLYLHVHGEYFNIFTWQLICHTTMLAEYFVNPVSRYVNQMDKIDGLDGN